MAQGGAEMKRFKNDAKARAKQRREYKEIADLKITDPKKTPQVVMGSFKLVDLTMWTRGDGGVGFTCDVFVNSTLAFAVTQDGMGGCNMYTVRDTELYELAEQFAKETMVLDSFEQLDALIDQILINSIGGWHENKNLRRVARQVEE